MYEHVCKLHFENCVFCDQHSLQTLKRPPANCYSFQYQWSTSDYLSENQVGRGQLNEGNVKYPLSLRWALGGKTSNFEQK